jgi:hypothetical protein
VHPIQVEHGIGLLHQMISRHYLVEIKRVKELPGRAGLSIQEPVLDMIEQVSSARRPNIGTTWSIFERCAAFERERAHYSILNSWYGFIVASVMQIIGCKLVPHGLG